MKIETLEQKLLEQKQREFEKELTEKLEAVTICIGNLCTTDNRKDVMEYIFSRFYFTPYGLRLGITHKALPESLLAQIKQVAINEFHKKFNQMSAEFGELIGFVEEKEKGEVI